MSKLVSKSVALADAVAEHHGDGNEEERGSGVRLRGVSRENKNPTLDVGDKNPPYDVGNKKCSTYASQNIDNKRNMNSDPRRRRNKDRRRIRMRTR